jgi:endonuclease G
VNAQTTTIAVMMPNTNGLKGKKWTEYITTVRRIEEVTGYNFFSNIDTAIQDIIETKIYKSPTK